MYFWKRYKYNVYGGNNLKKEKYVLISVCIFCGALIIAFVINVLFKVKTNSIFSAEWLAGDALNYVGTVLGAISTFILGLVAYKQNEKLESIEMNNYIALNSCMVLIDKIQIEPRANMPIDYELHTEQILKEKDNEDMCPSGYTIEIILKKSDPFVQATPSLIQVSNCMFLVENAEKNIMERDIWANNIRDGYTRVAIHESGIAFNLKLLISHSKQKKFEDDIKKNRNNIMVEFMLDVITDKYVMTKCKCRAYCLYSNMCGAVKWESDNPTVFFYGHELKNRNEIQVLGE